MLQVVTKGTASLSFTKASEKRRNLCRHGPMHKQYERLQAHKGPTPKQLMRRAKRKLIQSAGQAAEKLTFETAVPWFR